MKLGIQLTHSEARMPKFAHDGDAGADLYAVPNPDRKDGLWIIEPGQTVMVDVGLKFDIPEGWEVQIRPRSGLAKKGLTVANAPGTIDSGYKGPVKILLLNTRGRKYAQGSGGEVWEEYAEENEFKVTSGDRIAQIVPKRCDAIELVQVDEVGDSERGEGGFGSTGK